MTAERRDRLRALLAAQEPAVDALLVTSLVDVTRTRLLAQER